MKVNDLENAGDIFTYDPGTGFIVWIENGKPAGYINDRGYQIIEYRGKRYKGHRIAWTIYHGSPPDGQINHINQIKSDNRIENLQDTCCQTNMRNRGRQKNNTSGAVGVTWSKVKKRWIARIKVDGKKFHLGSFKDKDEAIAARQVAEQVYGFSENHGK